MSQIPSWRRFPNEGFLLPNLHEPISITLWQTNNGIGHVPFSSLIFLLTAVILHNYINVYQRVYLSPPSWSVKKRTSSTFAMILMSNFIFFWSKCLHSGHFTKQLKMAQSKSWVWSLKNDFPCFFCMFTRGYIPQNSAPMPPWSREATVDSASAPPGADLRERGWPGRGDGAFWCRFNLIPLKNMSSLGLRTILNI